MKSAHVIVIQMLLLLCFVTCADDMSIQDFYKQLGGALEKHKAERIVDLLTVLDGSTIWSFGSGIGPVDADSLQCVAVSSFLMLERGMHCQETKAVSRHNEKWCSVLLASPTNASVILRLLQSPKPAVRLAALEKLANVARIEPEVIGQLKNLSGVDPYVRIVKNLVKISGDTPMPPGYGETDLEFPLRSSARKILLSKGCPVEYDPEKEACEGVRYFAELWMSDPRKRADIQEAISLLGPNGYGVNAVKKLFDAEKDSPAYRMFCRQLEK